MPGVSVVIPTFNRAHYLGQAIGSVLAQTYVDFEVIVVDDGSTDSTFDTVHAFSDERIVYLFQSHQNPASARNSGIQAARADIVCFLDSDDLLLPTMLTEGFRFLSEHPGIGLIIPGRHVIDSRGVVCQTLSPWKWLARLDLHDLVLKGCPTGASAIMARREWLERVGGFEATIAANEDWDLLLRLARAGCRMTWLEKTLLCYRLHEGNLVRNVKLLRDEHLRTLDRLFVDDDLPLEVRKAKQIARARLLTDAAMNAYQMNDVEAAKADLAEAIALEPGLIEQNGQRLASTLRAHVNYWAIAEPLEFVNTVRNNLPDSALNARRSLAMVALNYRALTRSERKENLDG